MKNADIITITQFLNNFVNKKLPQKVSFAITKNITILNKEYEIYYTSLLKIFDQYREFSEMNEETQEEKLGENGFFIFKEEFKDKEQDFLQDISDLLNIEVDIKLYKISEQELNYDDEGKYDLLSPVELLDLIKILAEEEEA